MIAILTDKPNVGKEIARILGAHTREDGYMSGNGYMVTWTFGNMLSLAMPKDYGMDRPERGDFPINPAPFRLMVKHIRTRYGMDTGHQRGPPAESDRKSIRRLRKYHCGHRRLPGGRNGLQVPLPVSGMQETLPPSMDLVTYGRSRAGRNGQPQARQPV